MCVTSAEIKSLVIKPQIYLLCGMNFPDDGQWQDSEIQTERSWFETLQGEGDRDYLNEE